MIVFGAFLSGYRNHPRWILFCLQVGFHWQLRFNRAFGALGGPGHVQRVEPETKTVEIYEGQTLEWYCFYGAAYQPLFGAGWRASNPPKPLSENSGRIRVDVVPRFAILHMRSIRKQDAMTLECVNNGGKIVSRIDIVVKDTPHIRLDSDRQKGVTGGSAKFTCFFDDDIDHYLFWFHNGEVVHASEKYIVHSYKNRLTLRILKLDQSDSGEIVCRAVTTAFNATQTKATSQLEVSSSPRVRVSPLAVTTYEGASVSFTCYVAGEAEHIYNVTWMHTVGSSVVVLSTKRQLTLVNVSETDSDKYTCFARDFLKRQKASVTLKVKDVKKKMTIRLQGQTNKRNFLIPCVSVRKNRLLKSEIVWYKNDRKIDFESNHYENVVSLKERKSLEIKNISKNDGGVYRCIQREEKGDTLVDKTFIIEVHIDSALFSTAVSVVKTAVYEYETGIVKFLSNFVNSGISSHSGGGFCVFIVILIFHLL